VKLLKSSRRIPRGTGSRQTVLQHQEMSDLAAGDGQDDGKCEESPGFFGERYCQVRDHVSGEEW
jgi:hypothetical protein